MQRQPADVAPPDARAAETSSTSPTLDVAGATEPAPTRRSVAAPSSRAFPVPAWDRYEQIEFLGAGGMGRVFKAQDPRLGRAVALKVLRESEPELVRRLLREARAQARIEHEHICKVFEVGEVGGHPYIAMQYIRGRSLKEMKRDITVEQKVGLLRDVAEALHAAHRGGLIHRDIKPANIMVEEGEDGRLWPYVMDFGIAREVDRAGQTLSGMVEGTPSYMAPEQARGEADKLDRRTDVYSLGATLFDLLAGRPPFIGEASIDVLVALALEEAPPLRKLDAGIPVDLETIVMKCLEKEPASRYESAKALADDLGRYLAGEPIGARPATLGYLLAKKARKHKLVVAVGAAAVMVALGLGGAWLSERLEARDQARLAQRLGQDVKEMELFLRYAYALPLHDAGREKAVIRGRMQRLAAQAGELKGVGEGPLYYALGRGHLALHEPKEAIEQLEKAITVGYRTPEVELSLGLAKGELYQRLLNETQRMPDPNARETRRKELEAQHLAPALEYLKASSATEVESRHYIEAVAAYYSKDRNGALAKAREAFAESPWLYEAKRLEGEILHAGGDEMVDRGDHEGALEAYRDAAAALKIASDIARSDASVHEAEADVWLQTIDVCRYRGIDSRPALANALAALDKALASDATTTSVHTRRGLAYVRAIFQLQHSGADISELVDDAVESGKRATSVDPNDAIAHDIMGNLHLYIALNDEKVGRDPLPSYADAVASFEEAIRADPYFAWGWNDLGLTQLHLAVHVGNQGVDPRKEFGHAVASFKRAIEAEPKYATAPSNICYCMWHQSKYEIANGISPKSTADVAVAACEKALSVNPNHADAHDNLALIYSVLAEHALLVGDDPSRYLTLAKGAASKAVQLNPTHVEMQQNYIAAYWLEAVHALTSGRAPSPSLDKANAMLNELRKLAPKDALNELLHGKIELVAARAAMAVGGDPNAHFAAARAAFDKATTLNPKETQIDHAAAQLFRYAAEHRAGKRDKQAIELLESGLAKINRALALNPRSPAMLATSGALHLLRARVDAKATDRAEAAKRAENTLAEALRANPFLKREYGPLLEEAQAILKEAAPKAP